MKPDEPSVKHPGIYAIYDQKGRCYIGSSIRPAHRWRCHLHDLRRGKHHSPLLQNIFNKYGQQGLTFRMLVNAPRDQLCALEQQYIDTVKPRLNTIAFAGAGQMHRDPTYRKNLRDALRKANERPEYRTNRMKASSQKKAVRCVNDGRVFESGGEAARYYGITSGTVSACAKGVTVKTKGGLRFELIDGSTPKKIDTYRRPIKCIETGQIYPTLAAACEAAGVARSGIMYAIRRGTRSGGFHWADAA